MVEVVSVVALLWLVRALVWPATDISQLPGAEARAALPADGGDEFNRLIHSTSPYLLQHARNPVDWYEWGNEAFARARTEDKPVFLSVGYSTCHWCHVMARESFEDSEVADLLNAHFVPVKVDREERPDVDDVYMTFVQATTGRGGWPMSVFMTPEGRPFYGGTYFPQAAFLRLLAGVSDAWKKRRGELMASAARLTEQLQAMAQPQAAPSGAVGEPPAARLAQLLLEQYDAEEGGFGSAPKFPRPVTVDALMAFAASQDEHELAAPAREAALATLRAMARGGMYDHLGGGFHRYSVDAWWHVPHFEKMLYDQAQLVDSYLSAWQLSGADDHAEVAREVCAYVLRDLRHPDGGFYSAEDADSVIPGSGGEHGEGAFYVWTAEELRDLLGDDYPLAALRFGVAEDGNVRPESDPHGELSGSNVLYRAAEIEALASEFDLAETAVGERLRAIRERLLTARDQRERPHLDDKVIAAWNGLMIGALARAGRLLDEPDYVAAAVAAAGFVERELWDVETQTLFRTWRSGRRSDIAGFADDYAYLAAGLVEVFLATGEARYLRWARELHAVLDERFAAEQGGWYDVAAGRSDLLVRSYETYDGAEPAPNSVAANTAQRLALLTGDEDLEQAASAAIAAQSELLERAPHAAPLMVIAWMRQAESERTVVVSAPDHAAGRALREALATRYLPFTQLVPLTPDTRALIAAGRSWLEAMQPRDGAATAYFCEGRTCQAPTTDPARLAQQLDAAR